MKISIQGFAGSFHDQVANNLWGEGYQIEGRSSFREVFADVESGGVDFGLLAIENSIAGGILENYDLLRQYPVKIVGEYYLRIKHNLLCLPDQQMEDIKEVWSHPMALKQCQQFLSEHSHIRPVEVDDTARAAAQIRTEALTGVAAIAGDRAAQLYRMQVLATGIETNPQNYTRFLVIQLSEKKLPDLRYNSDGWKHTIYIETGHKPGALVDALTVLQNYMMNMTMLVSRPILGKPWQYGFYLDFLSPNVVPSHFWEELQGHTEMMRLLGSYRSFNLKEINN